MPRELGSGTGPVHYTAWKVSKYGVFSGQYFPAFSPNAGKCGPEKTPNLDTFHAVRRCNFALMKLLAWLTIWYWGEISMSLWKADESE